MSATSDRHAQRPAAARLASPRVHAPLALLLALLLAAAGCGGGLRRVGMKTGPVATAAKPAATKAPKSSRAKGAPKESGLDRNLRETREAATLAPAEPYWPFHLAELYTGADSLARAEVSLADALARDAGYAPALLLRARLDFQAGRHERAIRLLEGSLARPNAFPNGVPPEITEALALHYDALGKSEKAEALIAGANLKKGAAPPALVYLTLKGAKPEDAAPLAETAVKDDPRSAVNQNNWGIALLRKGDAVAARRAFEWAAKADPKLPGPWYNLAILEKYYFFDDSTATLRFAEYWQRSKQDPDGLAARFGVSEKKSLAQDE